MAELLKRTMSAQLIVHLRERILSGHYAPGAQLLQDVIAGEFGVSKIPVREALVQLQGEGLVDIFAHRGFQVRALSAAELEEVFGLRLQIEPRAAAEGCRMAQPAHHEAARALLLKLNQALAADDLAVSGNLNREFHLSLIVPELQPVTGEVLGRLLTLSQRYVQIHLSPQGRARRATREHSALFKAWKARKYKEVEAHLRAHIESTRKDLQELLPGKAWAPGQARSSD